jgi:hypothetical protein
MGAHESIIFNSFCKIGIIFVFLEGGGEPPLVRCRGVPGQGRGGAAPRPAAPFGAGRMQNLTDLATGWSCTGDRTTRQGGVRRWRDHLQGHRILHGSSIREQNLRKTTEEQITTYIPMNFKRFIHVSPPEGDLPESSV